MANGKRPKAKGGKALNEDPIVFLLVEEPEKPL